MVLCSRCKKKTSLWDSFSDNDSYFCKDCWSKIKDSPKRISDRLSVTKTEDKKEEKSKKDEKKSGVGGWLWFAAFVLTVISPVFILFSLFSGDNSGVVIIYNLFVIGLSIFCGVSIFNESENAIRFAKGFYLFLLTSSIYSVISSFGLPSYLIGDVYSSDGRNVIVAIFWLLYFNFSERVANTFKKTKLGIVNSIIIIFIALSLIWGIFSIASMNVSSAEDIFTPQQISNMDSFCESYCQDIPAATKFSYIYNPNTQDMECQCLDDLGTVISTKVIPQNIISSQYYIPPIKKITLIPAVTNDTLRAGYVAYYPFTDTTKTNELRLEFNSTLPITVHFVLSEQDYNNFMQGSDYSSYPGCSFYNQRNKQMNCNVSTGGLVVYNPNSQNATYLIKTLTP
jgi:hypothetical protein